jgi:hypothetical protein
LPEKSQTGDKTSAFYGIAAVYKLIVREITGQNPDRLIFGDI